MLNKRELTFSLPFRAVRAVLRRKFNYHGVNIDYTGEEANEVLIRRLKSDSPCLVGRFGATETNVVLAYLIKKEKNPFKKLNMLIYGGNLYYDKNIKWRMRVNAGFFPTSIDNFEKFSKLSIEDVKQIDILSSVIFAERILLKYNPKITTIGFLNLEPYYSDNPWTSILAGKKVLIISPFSKTIYQQYNNHREKIFQNKKILPKFKLITFQAVQSLGGEESNCGYESWFDAFDYMKNKINDIDFDIALISAGAYGMPLAAHIKRIKKKAVYMGGALQVLFGIKGKRYDNNPFYKRMYNEHWTRPSADERPIGFNNVEGGCYW